MAPHRDLGVHVWANIASSPPIGAVRGIASPRSNGNDPPKWCCDLGGCDLGGPKKRQKKLPKMGRD